MHIFLSNTEIRPAVWQGVVCVYRAYDSYWDIRNYGMHNDAFRGIWDYLIIQFFSDINCNTSDLLNSQIIKQFWVKLKPTEAILWNLYVCYAAN